MKITFAKISCVVCALLLSTFLLFSCGEDENPVVKSESATWSASVDGDPLTGDRVVITKMNATDYSIEATQKTGNYFVAFYLPAAPEVKVYDLSNSSGRIFYTSGNEVSNTGELHITKYNADSLVANFTFVAGVYEVTSGTIKAKLR